MNTYESLSDEAIDRYVREREAHVMRSAGAALQENLARLRGRLASSLGEFGAHGPVHDFYVPPAEEVGEEAPTAVVVVSSCEMMCPEFIDAIRRELESIRAPVLAFVCGAVGMLTDREGRYVDPFTIIVERDAIHASFRDRSVANAFGLSPSPNP